MNDATKSIGASEARDFACHAFDQWMRWNRTTQPEPTETWETNHGEVTLTISQACKLVWNDTGIVPGIYVDPLITEELPIRRRTYAACARAVYRNVNR
jgi:hypothetical protein